MMQELLIQHVDSKEQIIDNFKIFEKNVKNFKILLQAYKTQPPPCKSSLVNTDETVKILNRGST